MWHILYISINHFSKHVVTFLDWFSARQPLFTTYFITVLKSTKNLNLFERGNPSQWTLCKVSLLWKGLISCEQQGIQDYFVKKISEYRCHERANVYLVASCMTKVAVCQRALTWQMLEKHLNASQRQIFPSKLQQLHNNHIDYSKIKTDIIFSVVDCLSQVC